MKFIASGVWGFYVAQLFPLNSPHFYGLMIGSFITVGLFLFED